MRIRNVNSPLESSTTDILAAAPDCIKVLSASGEIRFINAFGLALLGATSANEVVGKSYIDLWPVDMQPVVRRALADAAKGQDTCIEGRGPTLEGAWRWWEAHFHAVDAKATEPEVICSARDITERREREIALQVANERLETEAADNEQRKVQFIATLAHELRNPLAPVKSGLQVLSEQADNQAAVETARQIMERQVAHMARLVDGLLDVARIASGKMVLEKVPVDLKTVIMEAIEATAPLMVKLHHTLSVNLPERSINLLGDTTRLIQVFSNLLDNAAKYTPDGGEIAVKVQYSDTVVSVAVVDSGIGLSEHALDRAFDVFTDVGRDAAGFHDGLGIGLNLARQLVQMHDGSVAAHSEGVGKGSQFIVTLPISEMAASAAEALPHKRHEEEIRILLVDDNADAATTLAMLLDYDGHIVRVAESGREALRLVDEFKPDIVFLDLGMPEMDGFEVARAVRARPQADHSMLIALSGWGGPRDRERTKKAGFNGHLTKPADLASIEAMLHRVKHQRLHEKLAAS